jgi:NAD(P)-dependent dehydrogenase (short-subunit alcohol dehydrogenase family)
MTGRALVIGASGGIGGALAAELAARGQMVTRVSRRDQGIDITDQNSVDRVLGALDPPFTTVVVATGILAAEGQRPEKSLIEIDGPSMLATLAANTLGPALILRHLPRLVPREGRSVTAVLTARVGSIGDNHMGGWYSYRASKAAANQIVRTAAIEIARKRPEAVVVALHPGTVDTPFTSAYPGHRKTAPQAAARQMVDVIWSLAPGDNGGFFDYSGAQVPW